jgi:hypothetical protein
MTKTFTELKEELRKAPGKGRSKKYPIEWGVDEIAAYYRCIDPSFRALQNKIKKENEND